MPAKLPIFKFALIKELKDDKRFLPTRGEPKASGWDVSSSAAYVLKPFDCVKIPLGFRAFCPKNWWFELKPRSSSFAKKHLHCLYGTIDETYEGQLVFACQYIPEISLKHTYEEAKGILSFLTTDELKVNFEAPNLVIHFGDAIGQIIPVKRQNMQVEEVSNEEYDALCDKRKGHRKDGGFGSTNK